MKYKTKAMELNKAFWEKVKKEYNTGITSNMGYYIPICPLSQLFNASFKGKNYSKIIGMGKRFLSNKQYSHYNLSFSTGCAFLFMDIKCDDLNKSRIDIRKDFIDYCIQNSK